MTTPFEKFFAGDFQKMLANVRSAQSPFTDGGPIAEASWDRRAAFLLWTALLSKFDSALEEFPAPVVEEDPW